MDSLCARGVCRSSPHRQLLTKPIFEVMSYLARASPASDEIGFKICKSYNFTHSCLLVTFSGQGKE
jgi:hypothetical protein